MAAASRTCYVQRISKNQSYVKKKAEEQIKCFGDLILQFHFLQYSNYKYNGIRNLINLFCKDIRDERLFLTFCVMMFSFFIASADVLKEKSGRAQGSILSRSSRFSKGYMFWSVGSKMTGIIVPRHKLRNSRPDDNPCGPLL